MFDAIVKSNGWDDDAAALHLLAHLEGDVLHVALLIGHQLVPKTQRVTRSGLVGALRDHYGSPRRLADYRCNSKELAVRQDGENLSVSATELETLAIRAFGDMGPSAQVRMIRDQFVTGHRDCDPQRHLDSVPPDRPAIIGTGAGAGVDTSFGHYG